MSFSVRARFPLPVLTIKMLEMRYTYSMVRAYEEIVDFIAAGTSPRKIIAFRPSEATKERVADLIHREKTSGLSAEEAAELGHYLQLEHLMRLTKARAIHHLTDDELH